MKVLKTLGMGIFLTALFAPGCSGPDDGPCADLYCGDHGTCDTNTNTCKCDAHYTGTECDFCIDGYHYDNGQCLADTCSSDADCDDAIACNGLESCVLRRCLAGVELQCQQNATCSEPDGTCQCDEGFVAQGQDCVEGQCTTDIDCDDGVFCNGEEKCIDGTCSSTTFDCMENAHCDESARDCVCDEGYTMDQAQCVAVLGIKGSWIDDWGSFHDITDSQWLIDDSLFHIESIDVSSEFLVAQNDAANKWNPEKWSRFDWTFNDDGDLFYCQIAFSANSQQEAQAANTADRTDLTTGCSGFGWSKLEERLEIIDTWEDPWGFEQKVSQAKWISGDSVFLISQFDNDQRFLVAHNDSNNQWNPGKWSRFDWTWDDLGQLYYCQIAYDKDTEEEAVSSTQANEQDLDSGCAGFAWSALYARPDIAGNWMDDWGYEQNISRESWTSGDSIFAITRLNNHLSYLVAHNDPGNQWNPGKWSRFDWTWDTEGQLYYCQIVFDANSADEAESNKSADRTDLQGGCAGFGWSHLNQPD